MRHTFLKILNWGAEDSLSAYDRRRIKTVNLLNLAVLGFLLFGFINRFIIGSEYPYWATFTFIVFCLLSLYLSKIKKTALAFSVFTFNVNASIFFVNQSYPIEAGVYLYYYTLIISVVLLNNPNLNDKFALFHFIICAAFFAANLLFDIPAWHVKNLSAEEIKVQWYFNLCISSFITAFMSILLTRLIANQNKEIIQQNEGLKNAKEAVNVSLKEKEILLAELHHRVKNNLAIISGLLNLQEDATTNQEARQVISDSKTRIMSMALVHRMLYENTELKNIDLARYSSELIMELFNSYNLGKNISIFEEYDQIVLPVNKSIPLGLILNEIVTNSIKYVFKGNPSKGEFVISIKRLDENTVKLLAKDNGNGFPKDFNQAEMDVSLGIYLIKTLSEQIDGKVRFSNDNGAKIELDFILN